MDRIEMLGELRRWELCWVHVEDQYRKLHDLFNAAPESGVCRAMFETFDLYTKMLGKMLGDQCAWLEWYCYDNNMGKGGLEVRVGDVEKKICCLKDLAWVLTTSCSEEQKESEDANGK